METILKGQDIIKRFEKLELKAYKPTPDDVWTIGWGTTRINGRPVHEGETCTKEEAQKYFTKDIEKGENCINRYVDVELTQEQFDALVSFCYNVGNGAFASSTLLKKLNKGDYNGAQKEFAR